MDKIDYTKEAIQKMNQFISQESIMNAPVIVKPIPETSEPGILDPRFYKKIKSLAALTKWVPDKFLKLGPQKQTIDVLKKAFDLKKSKKMTNEAIRVDQISIRGKDNNILPLRIYHPLNKVDKAPILYYIHGGGFFAGTLDVCDEFLRYIASEFDILIFSVDYRLAPVNPYPKCYEDCYEGFKWVSDHADYYQGDVDYIFVSGDSAGGNLAHYCTVKDIEEKKYRIKGQCLLYPTLNLALVEDENVTWDIGKYEISDKQKDAIQLSIQMIKNGGVDIMNGVLQTDTKNHYLTPYLYDGHELPPTLFSVGEFDYLRVETLAYASKLYNSGVPVETILYKGMGHGFGDYLGYFPQSEDIAIEVGQFILKYAHRIPKQERKILSKEQKEALLKVSEENQEKRKYSKNLLTIMNETSYVDFVDGNMVVVKPIPDNKYIEKIQKRLSGELKAQDIMINLAVEFFMHLNISEKTIDEIRKGFNEVKSMQIASQAIEVEEIFIKGIDMNDIPMKIYYPPVNNKKLPVYYFIHGGAFFAGSPNVVEQFVKLVVEKANVIAFSIDYRLAPEFPYPKGHEDCYSGLKWIYNHVDEYGGDKQKIFVSGDSAGGNLAQYCTTKSLEDQLIPLKGQMLFYPTVNLAEIDDSHIIWEVDNYSVDDKVHEKDIKSSLYSFKKGINEFMIKALDCNPNQIYLSPYLMERKDLPPTLLAVGEYDFLRIECLAYAAKLHELGIETKTLFYKGMTHGFIDSVGNYPQGEDLAIEVANFIKGHCK
ncbi:alpha/beta hydrolase [Anaerorhabdus sp.]|uniref:alpha/beta hydrolase n=1 Tax=Anaerorhabdus sp. TaxID=1872524 RepID=UPI002FC59BE8